MFLSLLLRLLGPLNLARLGVGLGLVMALDYPEHNLWQGW